jgi:hypothetical protein
MRILNGAFCPGAPCAAALGGVEAAVDAAAGDQIFVRPFFGDALPIDHDDALGMLDRRLAVGDEAHHRQSNRIT